MRFLRHKYHTKLTTLPIVQWGLLHESMEKGEPLFEYLLVLTRSLTLPKIKDKLKFKLMKVYDNLIGQLKSVDQTLKVYHYQFLYESNKVIYNLNKNKLAEINGVDTKIHINYDKCNDAFVKYMKHLSKNYKSFIFYKYELRPDALEHYEKIKEIKAPELIRRLFKEAPAFLTYYQYHEKVNEITDSHIFSNLVNNIDFINQFYLIKKHEVKNIFWYDKLIKKQFITYGNYDSYIMERIEIFNLDNLEAEPKNKYNFYKELGRYISYKNLNIDEFTTSVAKYLQLIDIAHQESKPDSEPKPNTTKKLSENG